MPNIEDSQPIPDRLSGERFDVAVASLYPEYSRNRLKQWIEQGMILLDGERQKPKMRVHAAQLLSLNVEFESVNENCEAEDIPLDILHEDDSVLVINKPADFVVHPAAGHYSGTLQNALLHHDPSLEEVPRAGIIHRLDKDTTGIMVVAKTLRAQCYLVEQMQQRHIHREYQAIIQGVLTGGGVVDQPIGRNPHDRKRMAIREDGKEAVTHYRLVERFKAHSHVRLKLETGRTHQIRVHMQSIRHPVLGDPTYGGRSKLPAGADQSLIDLLTALHRQMLHAWRLSFDHPETGDQVSWEAPLPDDMSAALSALRDHSAAD